MPKSVERCVSKVKKQKGLKPKHKGDTKEDAAWAICQASEKKKKMKEAVLAKFGLTDADLLKYAEEGELEDIF